MRPCILFSSASSFIALSNADDLIVVSIATSNGGLLLPSVFSPVYVPYGSLSSAFFGVRISTTLSTNNSPVSLLLSSAIRFFRSFSFAISVCNSLSIFSVVSSVTDSISFFSSSVSSSKYTVLYAPCVCAFLLRGGAPCPLAFWLPFCAPCFFGLFSSASFHLSIHFHFAIFAESTPNTSAISGFFANPSESKNICFAFSLFSSFFRGMVSLLCLFFHFPEFHYPGITAFLQNFKNTVRKGSGILSIILLPFHSFSRYYHTIKNRAMVGNLYYKFSLIILLRDTILFLANFSPKTFKASHLIFLAWRTL